MIVVRANATDVARLRAARIDVSGATTFDDYLRTRLGTGGAINHPYIH